MKRFALFAILCYSAFCVAQAPAQLSAPNPMQPPDFVKQGQQMIRDGKPDDALALYEHILRKSPDSVPALNAAGTVLDLEGKGDEARKHFARAIAIANSPEAKASAQRAMAMSYAFERNCGKAVEYEQQVFDYYGTKPDFFEQGEIADETARVCLDADDLDAAEKWYKIGHDTGLKEPGIKAARQDVWAFRWEHAQARIAARRGNKDEAQKHVAAAKAILDKGNIPEQTPFFPYLQAYVAFYSGDYKASLAGFQQSDQSNPFIQCMTAETYEKLGDKEKAKDYYKKASLAASHNPPAAYAVPLAKKKLASM